MKKTLLAAVLAATFGASAAFAGVSVPATTDAGNPFSLVVSGNVGLSADGTYDSYSNYGYTKTKAPALPYALGKVKSADGKSEVDAVVATEPTYQPYYSYSKSAFGLNAKDVGLSFAVTAPLMGDFSGFANFSLKFSNSSAHFGSYNFGVQNDQFGTLSFGKQSSAAGDMVADNSPGNLTVDSVGTTNNDSVSLKYTSPTFNNVTVAVSVGGVSTSSNSSQMNKEGTDSNTVNNSLAGVNSLSFGASFAQGPVSVAFTMEGQKSTETADGKDVHHYGSFATSLGGTFQYQNLTAYAFMALSTNDYANADAFTAITFSGNVLLPKGVALVNFPFDKDMDSGAYFEHVAQFGGNVGVSFDATDADNINVALKAATLYSNKQLQLADKEGVVTKHNMHYYMFGTEVQAKHSFTSNFSVKAYVAYDHVGVSVQNKPDGMDLPSANDVAYGLGLNYHF